MKTPRELLLERHRAQSPALDQLRERVISQEVAASRPCACHEVSPNWFAALHTWLTWQRAAWSGFAAVWCVILGLNLATHSETEALVAASAPVNSREFLAGVQENRAQLAALLSDREGNDEAAPRETKPAPRGAADRPRKDALRLNTAYA
jgi:hypothetical protein